MWHVRSGMKVYLSLGYTDMRKSVNGLSQYVSEVLEKDPLSGHLFVFCSRSRKILKILYWDHNGFALWYKKLQNHRFRWPCSEKELLELGSRELSWLLDGLSVIQPEAHGALNYRMVC
jgi:transposase